MKLARGVRGRLQLVVLLVLILALAVSIAGFNLLLWRSLSADASSRAATNAADETDTVRVVDGQVTLAEVDEGDLQSQVWVFAGTRVLRVPRVNAALDGAAHGLVGSSATYVDVPGQQVRLYALPLMFRGARVGTVVAGVSLAEYLHSRRIALIGSLILAGVVLVMVALGTRWVLGAALRPVGRMTAEAEAWSVRDLDRRFDLGEPYDELTHLAAGLDALLDRLAASLRREQRFSAEISHELRTPLAKVAAEAELALRRPRLPEEYQEALSAIMRQTRQTASIVDTLVAAAQQESGLPRGRADAAAVLAALKDARGSSPADAEVALEVTLPSQTIFLGVDADIAERILQPVVDNAVRFAQSRVGLSVKRAEGGVVFTICDDGPGLADGERERIFEPGFRGSAVPRDAQKTAGAGLGLALSRRLARAASGNVEAGSAPSSGACFVVRLPEA
jgi:two-component system, OmpR family, sensor kinase